MAEKDWYEAFSEHMNTVFTEDDFRSYKEMVMDDLKHYQGYLKPNARILDVGCGLGCTAVPLSALGYKVVGVDNDRRVVEAARQNGKNFGGDIQIIEGDIFTLNEMFDKDSFDMCISGGLLEHFGKEDIRKLVALQLELAPVVIASMPVKTERNMKFYGFDDATALNHVTGGICRNFWSEYEWVNDILKGFEVEEHFVAKANPKIGDFDEVFIVIKRK